MSFNIPAPTQKELDIIASVKRGLASDEAKSPFNDDKWYKKFNRANQDGVSLKDAPIGKLVMVVSESSDTLYNAYRGTAAMRGSVLIRVSENEVLCVDAYTWSGIPGYAPLISKLEGLYHLGTSSLGSGRVKIISDVVIV